MGGDVIRDNGTGGETIYGPLMPSEGESIGYGQVGHL